MTARPVTPNMSETLFGFDELFFSRTDEAGIIKVGNSVFQRVSVYSWDELIGKPHKIVRHPDMPRAVFWQLWHKIKRGEPIGAYVKNLAKDGNFYWVFAIVTPVEGGYLSVRLRPSSDLFPVIQSAYADLAALEKRDGLSPEESARILLDRLKELGFNSYESFMATALGKEIAARDAQLRQPQTDAVTRFGNLLKSARSLLNHAGSISGAFDDSEIVPTNFRILASRLGPEGAAISVISDNYTKLSSDMRAILDGFVTASNDVVDAINAGYFLVCTANIQQELLDFFQKETGAQSEQEIRMLDAQRATYLDLSCQGLKDIVRKADGFRQSCLEMHRLISGLEIMRIVGKIECSRHADFKDRVDTLLSDLERFQIKVSGALGEIEVANQSIRAQMNYLITQAGKAA